MAPIDVASQGSSSTITTIVVFGVVSTIVYMFLLKPLFAPTTTGTNARAAPQQRQQAAAAQDQQSATTTRGPSWLRYSRKPPHAQSSEASLVEGMISFRSSTAALATSDGDMRKERARILSRLLTLHSSASTLPPARGSTIVVSIPADDVECAQLRKILYLLGTYFTLVVVLCLEEDGSDTDALTQQLIGKLRGDDDTDLPDTVLPTHRIVASTLATGRIALVRQLGRAVEFVVTHEPKLSEELGRFGFTVLPYSADKRDSRSRLAAQLYGIK